eukprot:gene13103-14447_t
MMGYQNSTFPMDIYGCMDTCSRKMLWLLPWATNSDAMVVGKWHLEYLFATGAMPTFIRMDRGSETGTMATIHAYLHNKLNTNIDPADCMIYGPSTSNQVGNKAGIRKVSKV